MKELSKTQIEQRDKFINELHEIGRKLDVAYIGIADHIDAANQIIGEYNDKLGEVGAWRDEITADMDMYLDERSEKWQESDAGEDYVAWKEEWDGFDVSELDKIEALGPTLGEHAEQLQELPEAPG